MFKRYFILFFVCSCSLLSAQQESSQFIRKHLMRADGAIMPGFILKDNLTNVYLTGNLEYYMDTKVSIRGDINYLVGSTGLSDDSIGLKDNHSVFFGPSFHFKTNGHFDPYFVLQPGIAYTSSYKATFTESEAKNTKVATYAGAVSPLGTAGFGFNYYFQRFAHLFFETRYVYGKHLSEASSPLSLQELRVTFGLGFNAFVIKEKKRPE